MSKHTQAKQQNSPATPPPGPPALKKLSDPITALAAFYQGEKTDASYVFNTAMAMMGIAVAYLVGAIPFVDKLSHVPIEPIVDKLSHVPIEPIAWLFLLLLPIPLWLIVAFHSLMTLNAMSHGISVRIIEDALFEASELRVERTMVGSAAGDKIMDITQAKVVHKLTTVVVYGGVGLLVIGFTAYALYSAKGVVEANVVLVHAPVVEIAIATYLLLAIMVALSWIVGVRMIIKGRGEIPKHVKSSSANAGRDFVPGIRIDGAQGREHDDDLYPRAESR